MLMHVCSVGCPANILPAQIKWYIKCSWLIVHIYTVLSKSYAATQEQGLNKFFFRVQPVLINDGW